MGERTILFVAGWWHYTVALCALNIIQPFFTLNCHKSDKPGQDPAFHSQISTPSTAFTQTLPCAMVAKSSYVFQLQVLAVHSEVGQP